jgi:hypothetical protein
MHRLQQDLFQMQGYPTAQRNLVQMVDRLDHKGVGADLHIRLMHRNNGPVDAEITAVQQRYGSQFQRPERSQYGNEYAGGDSYYGRQTNPYLQNSDNYYNGRQNNSYSSWQNQDNYGRSSNVAPRYTDNQASASHNRGNEVARPGSLTPETMQALEFAQSQARQHGVNIDITSAGRTYQEQQRLYRELHGHSPVALPGTSSHEFGVAIDVKNYEQAKPYLLAAGFTHGDGAGPIPGDPWHFRYTGSA